MSVSDLVAVSGWPVPFTEAVVESSTRVTCRFVLVDDSRSMAKLDGTRTTRDAYTGSVRYTNATRPETFVASSDETHGPPVFPSPPRRFEECSRWDEAVSTAGMIATVSDASDTPAEIRLLTAGKGGAQPQPHQQPASRAVGLGKDGGASLSAVMALLDIEPFSAKTPICRHIREVADQIRRLTVASGKVAILVLLVDGAATDGDPADALRPLEGLPVQVIVRVYTEERDVHDYWHRVSSHVDLDVHVLGTALTEARRAAEHNPWLNYGEPLHRCALLPLAAPCPSVAPLDPPAPLFFVVTLYCRAREYGVAMPEVEAVATRPLDRKEAKALLEFLLLRQDVSDQKIGGGFPDPETDWVDFLAAVGAAVDSLPPVFCPLARQVCAPCSSAPCKSGPRLASLSDPKRIP